MHVKRKLTAVTVVASTAAAIALAGATTANAATIPAQGVPTTAVKPGPRTIVELNSTPTSVPKLVNRPNWTTNHIGNIQDDGTRCGTTQIDYTSGRGPSTISLSVNKSVAATWSANASVQAGYVSLGVGFNVTSTYTVIRSISYPVPSGKVGVIRAYPSLESYSFDVYDRFNNKIGSGYAFKPSGVCFDTYAD
ncbi:hypothetical protein K7472_31275 [Streptomyces sp. PTM05]|uniref:Uncharacterized protein n=1 Tax=Streptantibioticus parmotrematis TaxID=2873249 RepID=A0ABS7R2Y8_9ACTN|nr:hypothetical protein [Streptantibioticus parmotrematis]MBY8889291.1 hypothetical protein [Streptantibioticus parmotrematis]